MKISTLLVRGLHHKNFNEDFLYFNTLSEDIMICAAMDGCSSAKDSQFASAFYAKSLHKSTRMLPQMKEIMEEFDLEKMNLDAIAEFFMKQLFEDLKRGEKLFFLGMEELLSTIVLLIFNKKERTACIKMSGDGVFCINEKITEVDQNNAPNFLGYHLNNSFENIKNTAFQTWNFENVSNVSISTDGIDKLKPISLRRKNQIDPRKNFLLGNLEKFDNSFLQTQYDDLVKKGFVPNDDIGVIRIVNID